MRCREEILHHFSEEQYHVIQKIDKVDHESLDLHLAIESLWSVMKRVDAEINSSENEHTAVASKLAKEEKLKIWAIRQLKVAKDDESCNILQEIIEEAKIKIKDLTKRNQELQSLIEQNNKKKNDITAELEKKNYEIAENKKCRQELEKENFLLQSKILRQQEAYRLKLKDSKKYYVSFFLMLFLFCCYNDYYV